MPLNQINDRTRVFIDENRLRDRFLFAADPESTAIRRLNILREDAEPIERGVPHPTTYLLDRDGIVRFVDVRKDFHIWLDPSVITEKLATIP